MSDDPTTRAIDKLRGENGALRRALVILIDSMDEDHRNEVQRQLAASVASGGSQDIPEHNGYREAMDWLARHVGR